MGDERDSLKPVLGADRPQRRRLYLKGNLVLALLPTPTALGVLGLLKVLTNQRLLISSLA